MKVVLASHTATLAGGGERSLLEIASYLRARPSMDLMVVVPGAGPLVDELDRRGVTTKTIPYGLATAADGRDSLRASIASLKAIREFLAEYLPDVVMTNTSVIPWFAYAADRLGLPHAWFLREYVGADIGIDFYPSVDATLATIRAFSDVIFVNSEFIKGLYIDSLGRADIHVVYPTIGRDILPYVDKTATDFTSSRRDGRVFRIIVCGTIMPAKNQLEALQAARVLRQIRGDFLLTVMGGIASHPYRDALLAFVRTHGLEGQVRFLDHQDNAYETIAQHDIVVIPSVAEPFGRVTVEAMLLRKAVVASDAGGNREILSDAHGAGLLYPLGRPDVLAARLESLMADPVAIEAMGATAHRYAMHRFFQPDHLLALYAELQRAAARRKPSRPEAWITDMAIEGCRGFAESVELQRLRPLAARQATELQTLSTHLRAQDEELSRLRPLATRQEAQLNELRIHLKSQDEELARLRPCVGAQEAQLQTLSTHLRAQDEELSRLRPLATRQEAQLQTLSTHLRAQDEDLSRLRPLATRQEAQLNELRIHLKSQDEELTRLRPCVGAQEAQLEGLRQHVQLQDEELAQLRPCVGAQEAQLEELRTHLKSQDGELTQLRPCVGAQEAQLEELRIHLKAQDEELARLRAAVADHREPTGL